MYELDKEKFGTFLVQLRKEKGLTQKELAEKLYVSDKAVSKWERCLSLPDIALLQPMAEYLGVTVTELLSGRRIPEDQPLTVAEVEPLVTGRLVMTAREREEQREHRRRRGVQLLLSALACTVEVGLLSLWLPVSSDAATMMLWMPPVMAGGFGVCFLFLKERLPEFYDKYDVSFIVDGAFQMCMPGVRFNNRNWPYILRAMHRWSCVTMVVWPPVFGVIWWVLQAMSAPWTVVLFVSLLSGLGAILGGMFLPVVVVGRKYG